MRYEAIAELLSAAVASMVCHAWGVEHTHYVVSGSFFPDASIVVDHWRRYSVRVGSHAVSRSIGFLVGNGQTHQAIPFPSADREDW